VTQAPRSPRREPISEAHVRLGSELRRTREAARQSTRNMRGYSSGHISNVENGHVTPSKELIEAYAQLGGDRRKLLNMYESMIRVMAERKEERRREQRELASESAITVDSAHEQILSSYSVMDSMNVFRYDSRGVLAQLTCILRIKAKADVVRYASCAHNYLADSRRGVLSIQPGIGCDIVKTTESESGMVQCTLELDTDLHPEDDSYLYSYHLLVNSNKRMEPLLRQDYIQHRSRQAWQIQFTEPALPEHIWWFRSAYMSTTTTDAEEDKVFPTDPTGFYFHELFDLENELAGIAWRWRASN
jgi:hypothetical protein